MSKQDLENQQDNQSNEQDDFDAAFDEFSDTDQGSEDQSDEDDFDANETDSNGEADSSNDGEKGQEDDHGEQEPIDYKREYEALNHRFKSDLGRQDVYQRRIAEQEREIQTLKQGQSKTQEQEAGDNPENSGMSDAQWETLKEEFPEIAQGVEAKFNAFDQQLNQRLQQVDQTLAPIRERESQQALEREYQTLSERHPDYQNVAASTEFNQWLEKQPQPVRQLIESENAADAAYLLDGFKREQGSSNQPQQPAQKPSPNKALERARSVPRRGTPKQSTIAEDDYDAAFDHYAGKN